MNPENTGSSSEIIEKMKNSEILELSVKELSSRVTEEKANLIKLKFAHTVSTIENPSRIAKIKKDIARLNTEITKRKTDLTSKTT